MSHRSPNEYPEHLDRAATAIKEARRCVQAIHRASEDLRIAVEVAEQQLVTIAIALPGRGAVDKITERLSRLTLLRRSMEAGAFSIEADALLNGLWKELP